MTSTVQIKCDICNAVLKDNEIIINQGFLNISGSKPGSKYKIQYVFEGQTKKGDLCLSCARKFRTFIEDMKEGKIK